jgi:hypothetical protein
VEVQAIKDSLNLFDDEQRLMLVWHLATGVRPGGLYSLTADDWEDGEDPEINERYRTRFTDIPKDAVPAASHPLAVEGGEPRRSGVSS